MLVKVGVDKEERAKVSRLTLDLVRMLDHLSPFHSDLPKVVVSMMKRRMS